MQRIQTVIGPRPLDNALYDLTGLTRLEWTPVWPTPPSSSSYSVATTIAELQTQLAINGRTVQCASATTFVGDITSIGDNVTLLMPNDSTLRGAFMANGVQFNRFQWRGGNWDGQTGANYMRMRNACYDIAFINVSMDGRVEVRDDLTARIAFVSCTIDGDASAYALDGNFFSSANIGEAIYDQIWANCLMKTDDATSNYQNRLQNQKRFLGVDNYCEAAESVGGGPSGHRFGQECDQVHLEGLHKDYIILDRIFCSLNGSGEQQLDRGRFENVTRYTAGQVNAWATFLTSSVPADDSGTAQSATSTTIRLAATASASDDAHNGDWVKIMSGTGKGQHREITDYVGATKDCTVAAWDTTPDNTSVYQLSRNESSFGNVNNCQIYSDTGGVGSPPNLGELFTEVGNPNVLSYDGSTHPATTGYGADH